MKPSKKIISHAIETAKKSTHKYRIGAVIWHRKLIISNGWNHSCKSVRSITKRFTKNIHGIHAEVDAIIRARSDLRGTNLLVIRINKNEGLCMSKPCAYCLGYIDHVGIKNVYFVDNNREIKCLT